jgi:hypothetical protein
MIAKGDTRAGGQNLATHLPQTQIRMRGVYFDRLAHGAVFHNQAT